jgi:hypothetical protein
VDTAKGMDMPTAGTSQEIDLGPLPLKRIIWTVLIVQPKPYKRLTLPGDGKAYMLAVCKLQEETCTRSKLDANGDTITETYACNKQVCP